MSYYSEQHSHIKDKVKVVLELSNYAKLCQIIILEHVMGIDTVPEDLKKLSDVVDNEVVKNTKFNTLKYILIYFNILYYYNIF